MLHLDQSLPPFWHQLDTVVPPTSAELNWSGPRRWWGGPLDVEGLALGSVRALAAFVAHAIPSKPDRCVSFTSEEVAGWFNSLGYLRISGRVPLGFQPVSGFHQTSDGWVRIHANYPHHEGPLLDALRVNHLDLVGKALKELPSLVAEERILEHGGVAAAVRKPEDWLATATSKALSKVPWVQVETSDCRSSFRHRSAAVFGGESDVLAGVRVLDLTRVLAGPSASRLLGALGADVLRIDPPAFPELLDLHIDTGFAKRSAIADFGRSSHLARVKELIVESDIILTGYRGGSLDRYGLSVAALRNDYPHVGLVSLDAWGDQGPRKHLRGFDSIVQAATGISHIYSSGTGERYSPGALPVQALDFATGMGVATAAIGLITVRRSGQSGSAHLSLARTAEELLRMGRFTIEHKPKELRGPLRGCRTVYGDLEFVPPPISIGKRHLEYPSHPEPYGSASLSWK